MKKSKTIKRVSALLVVFAILLSMFSGIAVTAPDIRVVSLETTPTHTFALKSNGSLWAWGLNTNGQLGDGTTIQRNSPVQVLTNVASVTAGTSHTMAIRTDGTLWTWGLNTSGQLGDGTTTQRTSPVQVLTNVVSVSAGPSHTMAIRTDGTLWAWGLNAHCQLGDGTTTQRNSPVQVLTNVASVSTEDRHTIALRTDGTLWAWGLNLGGQLGDGTRTHRVSPVRVLTDVASKIIVDSLSMAIRTDGSLWAWGDDIDGQLGINSEMRRLSPAQVLTNVASVTVGSLHTMAIRTDGTLWAWGRNDGGRLGDGTTTQRFIPVQVLTDVAFVTVELHHTMAIRTDGTLWGWGSSGQLGLGLSHQSLSPAQVLTNVTSVATDVSHSMAIRTDGSLWVWGGDTSGQVGNGEILTSLFPSQIMTRVVSAEAVFDQSFAIRSDGTLWAWGLNTNGRLGNGTTTNEFSPVRISLASPNIYPVAAITMPTESTIDAFVPITCASVDSNGTIESRAWSVVPGVGFSGTLVDSGGTLVFTEVGTYTVTLTVTDNQGSTDITQRAIRIARPLDSQDRVVSLEATPTHTFALKSNGSLWSWGLNTSGQLGDGTVTQRLSPVQVLTNVASVTAGTSHTMAIRTDGTLWTWGLNTSGQLGDSSQVSRPIPVQVLTDVTSVAAGPFHAMAIRTNGELWAWGLSARGQLGDNTVVSPVRVLANVASVTAEINHTMAIRTDGTLWAWGLNTSGQLGDGTTMTQRNFPVQVLTNVTSVTLGPLHSMAIRTDGTLWAWGDNGGGRLGDGTGTRRRSPVQVLTNVASVTAGAAHTMAIRTDGSLWAWGLDSDGQIGNGAILTSASPAQIMTQVVYAEAVSNQSFSIRSDGTLWAWGLNTNGSLGDETILNRFSPVQIIPADVVAPVAAITAPATALTGAPVVIACASTDSDGSIANRVWTVTPSTGFTGSLIGTGGTLTFTAAGTYTIGLTVTDNQGATNVTSRAIIVTMANVAPVAAITAPATAITGTPVVVACASTDSDGTIATRAWTVTPSTGFTGSLTGTGGTLTFTAAGTYTIGLTVTDNQGATNVISRTVIVNTAPVAVITAPATALTSVPVAIVCASTDSDGSIANRAWTITPSTGFTGSLTGTGGTLTFTAAGTYTIDLTVTDNQGATNVANRVITVINSAPVAVITSPLTALVNSSVMISCASFDSNGTVVSREWGIIPSSGFTGSLGGVLTFTTPGDYVISLTITDNQGATDSTNRTITVTNTTPDAIISAPSDALIDTPVTIVCLSADIDGHIFDREWVVSPSTGFTGTLEGTGGTLRFTVAGTYILNLTVTDSNGATDSTERIITITNTTPVASFSSPANTLASTPVAIICTSSDADGLISNRSWTITPSVGFSGALSGTGGTLAFTTAGTYTIHLLVTDNHGATESTSRAITVTNTAPVAAIVLPANAITETPVAITCASTDADGTIVTRNWTITPSSGVSGSLSGTGGALTFISPGTYLVQLTVIDNLGATRSTSRSISVTAAVTTMNILPTSAITMPANALVGATVMVVCSSADPDGIIANRTWVITPSTGFTGLLTGTGEELIFNVAGTYSVRLTVTDDNGGVHSSSRSITVTNAAPVARIIAPASANVGIPIVISCGSTDTNGYIASRIWNVTPTFGFAGLLQNTGGTLTFTTTGTYTIRLTVTDNHGGTNIVSRTINVTNAAPVAGMTIPANAVTNTPVTITCTSTDSDGTITNRVWTITPSTGFTGTLTGTGGTLTFTTAGSYVVRITVTDNSGRATVISRTINVSRPSPVAVISVPENIVTGTPITITCSSASIEGVITNRAWTITPGTGFTGALTGMGGTLNFATARAYTIRLTITNSFNMTNVVTRTIVVRN